MDGRTIIASKTSYPATSPLCFGSGTHAWPPVPSSPLCLGPTLGRGHSSSLIIIIKLKKRNGNK